MHNNGVSPVVTIVLIHPWTYLGGCLHRIDAYAAYSLLCIVHSTSFGLFIRLSLLYKSRKYIVKTQTPWKIWAETYGLRAIQNNDHNLFVSYIFNVNWHCIGTNRLWALCGRVSEPRSGPWAFEMGGEVPLQWLGCACCNKSDAVFLYWTNPRSCEMVCSTRSRCLLSLQRVFHDHWFTKIRYTQYHPLHYMLRFQGTYAQTYSLLHHLYRSSATSFHWSMWTILLTLTTLATSTSWPFVTPILAAMLSFLFK